MTDAGTLVQQGIAFAKQAIEADKKNSLQEAAALYASTVQCLQSALAIDTNAARRDVTQKKCQEYSARLRQIESKITEKFGAISTGERAGERPVSPAPSGQASDQYGSTSGATVPLSGSVDVLCLWVTDHPSNAHLTALKERKMSVLMTQTFAEGMKVLRKNTNITHVINNVHRAGGALAATHELVDMVQKYDSTLPIILTTFEVDEKERKKKAFAKRMAELQPELTGFVRMGATAIANTMDDLLSLLSDVRLVENRGAKHRGITLKAPQGAAKPYGRSVVNQHGLEYFIGDKLGSGNFGVIHNCQDVYGQDFVVKVLKTNRPQEEVQADWAKEVQFLFTLNHPNIVQLYDAFEHTALYHMVMERCSGSMRDYVTKYGKMDGADVVRVGGQLCSALGHVHNRNIIHRDLHVDNILYAPPRHPHDKLCVKVTDFGISKLLKPTENAAVTFIGRDYDYCPELVTKGHTTKRSDIYQLGLVLYHLYTGKHALSPNDGNNVVQIVTSGLARKRAEALNSKLGDVIGVCLRRDADYRYQDTVELWHHLSAVVS